MPPAYANEEFRVCGLRVAGLSFGGPRGRSLMQPIIVDEKKGSVNRGVLDALSFTACCARPGSAPACHLIGWLMKRWQGRHCRGRALRPARHISLHGLS